MRSRHNRNVVIAAASAWWLSNIVIPAKALQYGCAAERDERNALPYTAAMEWRKAAELLPFQTRAAEYCWRQWERIMQLPRRLAGPFDPSSTDAAQAPDSLAQHSTVG
jgi:hypothetical protein